MTTYDAPHNVTDKTKLAAMIETIRTGGSLPPIVVCGDTAFCGSHRIEAYIRANDAANASACLVDSEWEAAETDEIPAVEIDDDTYSAAMRACGLDPHTDEHSMAMDSHNGFCSAIYDVCDDAEVKAALADQRGL